MSAVNAWVVEMPFSDFHPANIRATEHAAIRHYFGADEIPMEYLQQGYRCIPVTITKDPQP